VAIVERAGYSLSWEATITSLQTWEEIFALLGDDWSYLI